MTGTAGTLVEALQRAATGARGLTVIRSDVDEERIAYRDLYEQALVVLGALRAAGMDRGDELVIQLDDVGEFVRCFWAALLGGFVPVPLAVPANAEASGKLFKVWGQLDRPYLVTARKDLDRLKEQEAFVAADDGLRESIVAAALPLEDLAESGMAAEPAMPEPGDVALIQYSSGSTGDPKGVVLTHANLMGNALDIASRSSVTDVDTFLCWMPLTHDMGLVAFHLTPITADVDQIIMPTRLFVRNPGLWMKKADEHRATITGSPNFGYKYLGMHLKAETAREWDLSCVRVIWNGAEPISAQVCEEFIEAMAPYGLPSTAIVPSYGLAEASLAVTIAAPGEPLGIVTVDRSRLSVGDEVCTVEPGAPNATSLVCLGPPVSRTRVRIASDDGSDLGERRVGRIQVSGSSVSGRYHNNPDATRAVRTEDGWLDTGDLGFLFGDQLVATGRSKDVIFVNGMNFFPHDIERVVAALDAGKPGYVAATGVFELSSQSEEIVLFVVCKRKLGAFYETAEAMKDLVARQTGLIVHEVVPVKSIPKTTSGKMQRFKLRERYEAGEFADVIAEVASHAVDSAGGSTEAPDMHDLPAVQRAIADIWRAVLGVSAVGLDDAFLDLGGSSVAATKVHLALERVFPGRVRVTDLYTHQTVREIAAYVAREDSADETQTPAAVPAAGDALTDIAVVGMAGRFADCDDIDDFWRMLTEGRSGVRAIERWDEDDYFDPDPDVPGRSYCRWAGLIDGIDEFDAHFFGITPAEAEVTDPQQRLFLQEAYHALEDAGLTRQMVAGASCGVFAGLACSDYQLALGHRAASAQTLIGNSSAILASRISYYLDLKGPAVTVDTACSASLVAVHLAADSIRRGECDLAIAGGVTVFSTPDFLIQASKAGMLSADGACHAFDRRANGMVPGEGAAAVVLKPLAQATLDGDHVYCVIRGSGINQDGKTSGITAPCLASQAELERGVYRRAGIDPGSIGYVEAHGTGTELGDPIEVDALAEAFGVVAESGPRCALGSVKTNLGHTIAAAGVAGLMKAALCLERRTLVPSLNYESANPHIDFARVPFTVNTETRPWDACDGATRRAAISAFGFSGTNAHVVIEEAPTVEAAERSGDTIWQLVTVSAASQETLGRRVGDLADFLRLNPECDLADLAGTLLLRREHHRWRRAVIAQDVAGLLDALVSSGAESSGHAFAGTVSNENDLSRALETLGRTTIAGIASADANERLEALRVLAGLYVGGVDVHWHELFPTGSYSYVRVPVYPFARDRYWIPDDAVVTGRAGRTYQLFEKAWRARASGSDRVPVTGRVVVVASRAVGEDVRGALSGVDGQFVWVDGTGDGVLDRDDAASGRTLGRRLLAAGAVSGLIDLSAVGASADATTDVPAGTIALLQELVAGTTGSDLNVLHVTQGLCSLGPETPVLAGAVMHGLVRVLSSEYSHVSAVTVDIGADDSLAEALPQILVAEFGRRLGAVEVAYREGARYEPLLRKTYFESALEPPRVPDTIDPERAVVVTGGTSGLGSLVARHLAGRGVRKLILMGRQPLPPQERWPEEFESLPDDDPARRKLARLLELTASGAEIETYTGPLTDADELASFLDGARARLGAIQGVIHCAGTIVQDNPAFVSKRAEDIAAVMEPKVAGTRVLLDALGDDALEFFISFSSVAAASPALGVGLADYAAANGFLDHLAMHRTSDTTRFTSVEWPSWDAGGMGKTVGGAYRSLGFEPMAAEEGLYLLDVVLGKPMPPVVMAAVGERGALRVERVLKAREEDRVQQGPPPVSGSGVSADTPPSGGDHAWLRALIADRLRMTPERLDVDAGFAELGVDSIMLAELIRGVENEVGARLEPTAFIEHPSVARLGAYLAKRGLGPQGVAAAPITVSAGEQRETPAVRTSAAVAVRGTAPLSQAIAIIGTACHFPGAPDTAAFWRNLAEGVDSVDEVPASRWDVDRLYSAEPAPKKSISKWGGFLEGIEYFDPEYFGLSAEVAPHIDPLIRQFLEVAVETLANAGYEKSDVWDRRIGVFVGSRVSNYAERIATPNRDTVIASGQNFIAAHVSHLLNLKGPSVVVDTACSSSLVALHMACRSLVTGECEMALAGGADILLDEKPYLFLSEARALSPDGVCYTFDERANGFVPGEGAGAVILKTLERARADGDRIYAVIDASAVNNDGHTMGVTTPNPDAQMDVIRTAHRAGAVDPASVSYIETHGTGTMIGDPIELKALKRVFEPSGMAAGTCAVGSVKTNIGHLLSAAGIASLIKVVLMIQNGTLPPTLHCETPNPRFDFGDSPFFLVTSPKPWEPASGVRRAAISSFGFGGTNAHVVLSAPMDDPAGATPVRAPLDPPRFRRSRHWLDGSSRPAGPDEGERASAAPFLRLFDETPLPAHLDEMSAL